MKFIIILIILSIIAILISSFYIEKYNYKTFSSYSNHYSPYYSDEYSDDEFRLNENHDPEESKNKYSGHLYKNKSRTSVSPQD